MSETRPRFSWASGAALGVLAFCALLFGWRALTPIASSSADYAPVFAAANAIDRNEHSEWLLPDGATGFLELALWRRRSVERVRIKNGYNPPFGDRAIRRARIVVYDDDREVDSAEVDFAGVVPDAPVRTVELAGKLATRVRIHVIASFGLGGALAEVTVD